MKIRTALVTFLFISSLACESSNSAQLEVRQSAANGNGPSETSSPASLVSIVALIGAPERFNGRRIQAIGFTHLEFEDTAIYLSTEDYQYGLTKNGISLDMSKSEIAKYRELNDSYVIVEGTFVSDGKGHFTTFSGSIENITLIKRWARVGAKPQTGEK